MLRLILFSGLSKKTGRPRHIHGTFTTKRPSFPLVVYLVNGRLQHSVDQYTMRPDIDYIRFRYYRQKKLAGVICGYYIHRNPVRNDGQPHHSRPHVSRRPYNRWWQENAWDNLIRAMEDSENNYGPS